MTPIPFSNPIKTFHILQLNCHRSPAVFHSLFNDPSNANRHIIMMQERAIYLHSGFPMANPNWVQYLSSTPPPLDPNAPLTAPRCRCVTYVNKKIQSHFISQSNSQSSLVVALKIVPSPASSPINLINAYLPPGCDHVSQTLSPAPKLATVGPTLLGMDSNLHYSTWNPPNYLHTHRLAEDLIHLAAAHHLILRSELGVPTFYVTSDRLTNTTIDLIWVNEEANDLATACTTDTSLKHSYSSDHAAILTTLDLPESTTPLPSSKPKRNWKKMNKDLLATHLSRSLPPLVHFLQPSSSPDNIDAYVSTVTATLNQAIEAHVPLSSPPPNARRWWDEATLGPMKRKTSALRRKYQRYKSTDNREAYLKAAKSFHLTILKLKHKHRKRYLSELDDKSLFDAARFTEGPSPPSFITPLRLSSGSFTSDPTTQADLLFTGTSAPTTIIDLSDLPPEVDSPQTSPAFTTTEATSVISNLKPSKAPGPDKILSKILQLGGPLLAACVANIANACIDAGYFPSK